MKSVLYAYILGKSLCEREENTFSNNQFSLSYIKNEQIRSLTYMILLLCFFKKLASPKSLMILKYLCILVTQFLHPWIYCKYNISLQDSKL